MVVVINGSREFNNYSLLEEKCYEILSPFIEKGDKIIVVEGDARGADKLAGRFAKEQASFLRNHAGQGNAQGKISAAWGYAGGQHIAFDRIRYHG